MNTITYDDLLIDKHSISQELFCTICSNLINNAHQCNQNGHLFCENCIKEWLKTQTTCPSCRCLISIDSLSKSRLANNLIGSIKIYCPNLNDGCKEITCIDQLQSHLQICKNRLIKCPNNKNCEPIRLNLLDEHLEICRFNYTNNCLYRTCIERNIQIDEIKSETNNNQINNCKNNFNTNNILNNELNNNNEFNWEYLNYLQMKVNELELKEEEHQQRKNESIVGEYQLNDDINHAFDWIIQNYNEKIKMMGQDGYFEIIPFDNLLIRFYPNKTEYFTTPCKPGVTPIEIMSIKIISKCLIPLELKITIQSPINREVVSLLKKDIDLDIKFDKINNIKSDLKLSFIVNLKKKYLNLFTS